MCERRHVEAWLRLAHALLWAIQSFYQLRSPYYNQSVHQDVAEEISQVWLCSCSSPILVPEDKIHTCHYLAMVPKFKYSLQYSFVQMFDQKDLQKASNSKGKDYTFSS